MDGYAVLRTIETLEALAEAPVTAITLADALAIHPRTSRRILHVLAQQGLVTRAPGQQGYYAATGELRQLGQRLASAPGLGDRSD